MKKTHRRGFTLIELLVVVSIIALLVSILLPALAEARRQGKLAVDQNNQRQIGISMLMYAGENNNNFPRIAAGNWLFDVAYSMTDYILATGGDKGTFYCPLEGVKNPDEDIFWRATECWGPPARRDMGSIPEPESKLVNYKNTGIWINNRDLYFRVSGYFWLLALTDEFRKIDDFKDMRPGPPKGFMGNPSRTWVTKSTQRYAAETEFIVDITVVDGSDPETAKCYGIRHGLWYWGVEDKTAHLGKDMKPRDGNCLFVDGHVQRKYFDEMVRRYLIHGNGLPYHWW